MNTSTENTTSTLTIDGAIATVPTTGPYNHHGDVILMPIGNINEAALPTVEFRAATHMQPLFPPSAANGHAHAMNHPENVFISGKEGDERRQLIVTDTVMLLHTEHAASVIPAGHYAVYHAREMTMFGDVQNVVD